jgi:Phosphoglucose isomerase
MGVELGKVLAKNILSQLEKPEDVKGHDSSVCLLTPMVAGMLMSTCHFIRLLVLSTTIRNSGRSERTNLKNV